MNSGCDTYMWRSIFVLDVVFLLELGEFLLSSRKLRLRSCRVLLGGHVIEDDDIAFLQMEAVQMVKSILGLSRRTERTPWCKGTPNERKARPLTSMTSSKTTNAVPFVFCSFPMRICLMLPYRPNRS